MDVLGFGDNRDAAKQGGAVAGNAHRDLEAKSGKPVVSRTNHLGLKGTENDKHAGTAPPPAQSSPGDGREEVTRPTTAAHRLVTLPAPFPGDHSMHPIRSLFLIAAITLSAPALATSGETLPSGVVVNHIKTGAGASPTASDTVKVHYRGTLLDGTEFDSSYRRNAPISFPLRNVIPCWTQGVQKLKVGGKARLTCPADTAYGARGVPGVIPPNSVLSFEVELLAIER